MSHIPSPPRCIELLRENGCSEEVINHCKVVRDLAVRIAEKTNANIDLVEAGALLHDIGRSKTHGIKHGIEGAKIAREIGLQERIIKIIERHLGGGIPKDEAVKLGLPNRDYIPKTLEEKIVAHTDNLIDEGKKQPIEKEVEEALKKGQKQLAERLIKLHNELSDICGMNLNDI
ncbi:MAG: HDIG domain-containing protein [Thermoplasmatales archaeon]|nr:MAG: HDIG domain-containing protein [Thermoplasmatales archaeon]